MSRSGLAKIIAGAAALAGAAWAFDKYAQHKFQRSGVSLALNKSLELYPHRSVQQEMAWLDERKGTERTNVGVHGVVLKSGVASLYDDGNDAESETFGMSTYRFAPKDFNDTIAPHTTILYIHGGAYVSGISPMYVAFATRLANRLGVNVLVPDYNPAPYGTAEDAYRQITALYTQYRELNPHQKIILLGDSAGAGLALGLAQEWSHKGIQAPEGIIAISPWVDANLTNPEIEAYADRDPMLVADTLRVDAREWAGNWSMSDPRISPALGDLKALKNSQVTIFVGTDEIFFPDVTNFATALTTAGVHTKLHIGEKMVHAYPLIPIPEAKESIDHIEMAVIEAIVD
ncbi:alpha/beta hydrolase [Alloscardovia theropitheci]|uniref:Alpha/beta hydrolase n=1 Tax=Alloscardovia theropitheci TaxID=2496842 RepID=A0A4R0QPR9_9BIFI|nr:alpha/beta hydrolase [Alloscardovia theropitheci]TCD54252.1 alpha/beta hydrolase [Alloscardovia theropitheci]